jgi:hypothetical protein
VTLYGLAGAAAALGTAMRVFARKRDDTDPDEPAIEE